jgi:hypothetical protein
VYLAASFPFHFGGEQSQLFVKLAGLCKHLCEDWDNLLSLFFSEPFPGH